MRHRQNLDDSLSPRQVPLCGRCESINSSFPSNSFSHIGIYWLVIKRTHSLSESHCYSFICCSIIAHLALFFIFF